MLDSSVLVLGAPNPFLGIICVVFVLLPIGLAIGAVILRAAISMFNKFAGYGDENPNQVPEPSMGKAMAIVLITGVANWIVGALIGSIGAGALKSVAEPWKTLIPSLLSLPFSFFVSAGLLSGLLPTTFKRGLGVAACEYLVAILVGMAIGVLAALIGIGLSF